MMKRNISCPGEARTGPVNLALWWAAMTRGFTGHKLRGMRETWKWPTVSIFCQATFTHFFFYLCVYVCACPSLTLIITSSSVIPNFSWTMLSALHISPHFLFIRLHTQQEQWHCLTCLSGSCKSKIKHPVDGYKKFWRRKLKFELIGSTHRHTHSLMVACGTFLNQPSRADWQLHYDCCWHIRLQLSTLAYSLFNCLI